MAHPAMAKKSGYVKGFPGWYVETIGNSKYSKTVVFSREDRLQTSIRLIENIYMNRSPAKTREEVTTRVKEIKDYIADLYKSKCSSIKNLDAQNQRIGFLVMDNIKAPKCMLFISATKKGRFFANLLLDDGTYKKLRYTRQQIDRLWLYLAHTRVADKPVLSPAGKAPDLEKVIESIPNHHVPSKVVLLRHVGKRSDGSIWEQQKMVPLFRKAGGNPCSNWSPLFYSPYDLSKAKLKSLWAGGRIRCKLFAWKEDADTKSILAHNGRDWKPLPDVLGNKVVYNAIQPFAKGEKLDFRQDASNMFSKVFAGSVKPFILNDLDIAFLPEGRFCTASSQVTFDNIGIMKFCGRYYVDGYFIALAMDNGPVVTGFGGKLERGGKIERIFIGEKSFQNGYIQMIRKVLSPTRGYYYPRRR